ncbi:MAG: hypothetical protein U0744_16965 [Gemmataceae bacterium]
MRTRRGKLALKPTDLIEQIANDPFQLQNPSLHFGNPNLRGTATGASVVHGIRGIHAQTSNTQNFNSAKLQGLNGYAKTT